MNGVSIVNDSIYRIVTPYCDISTTMYVIKTDEGVMIFDTASGDSDITDALLPFLENVKIDLCDVKYIFISHKHRDHARGLGKLLEKTPDAVILSRSQALKEEYPDHNVVCPEDGDVFMSVLSVVTIPGHTLDSAAILDTRTKTMITGDCLQLGGIFGSGNWACNITFIREHFEALDKLEKMDINNIYTAHDYHPLGYKYLGKYEVKSAIDECRKPLLLIADMIKNNPDLDDEEIRAAYNASGKLPKLGVAVVAAIRNAIEEGVL